MEAILIRELIRSRKGILLLLLVVVIVAFAALSYWNSTSGKVKSSNGTFEDQYISFSYPTSLVAVQYTYENYTLVDFYNSTDTNFAHYVGNIRFSTNNLTNLQRVYSEGAMGKYKSYRTWQGTDINGPYVFILLDSGNTGVQTLQMDFKSEYRAAYNEILKTLIKQIPVLDILR